MNSKLLDMLTQIHSEKDMTNNILNDDKKIERVIDAFECMENSDEEDDEEEDDDSETKTKGPISEHLPMRQRCL